MEYGEYRQSYQGTCVMDAQRQELLEIYKLHAELADRVSQRREGANRLYVSLLIGLAVFVVTFLRFGTDSISTEAAMFWAGVLGAVLAASWYVVIRSYRQLNTGKFNALQDLESHLAYPFFTKEWELLGEGKKRGRYWKLTIVETALPWIFFLLFVGLAIYVGVGQLG